MVRFTRYKPRRDISVGILKLPTAFSSVSKAPVASGVLALREKLGPILWQFPPNFRWSRERFEDFFALLPLNTTQAAKFAKKHDDKMRGRAWLKTDVSRPLRYAVEVRHPSFITSEFVDLLREHKIALVFADTAGKWPYAEDLTADFVYIRLHGDKKLYVSGYGNKAINQWADRIEYWRRGRQPENAKLIAPAKTDNRGRDIFVYFDNDAKVHAPFDAKQLAAKVSVHW
jgi:uncharacterized protein YecE (DUF72 family)